jgi:ECF transporter S component (folate family)
MKQNPSVKRLTTMAVLIAMNIILTRFLSIQTPIVRIGFSFLPIAISAILYGPWWAGGGAAAADLLGMMLFPTSGYFPGFTLTAFLTGAVFGLIFYNKTLSWPRVIAGVAVVCLVINLGLDTVWLYFITGQGYAALFVPRIIKTALMIPIETIFIYLMGQRHLSTLLSHAK